MRVTDLESGQDVHFFDIRRGGTTVYVVGFSQDGQWALSGGFESAARLWNVAAGKAVDFDPHTHVYGGALLPDGRLGSTGGGDAVVRLWNMATRVELARYSGHGGHVYAAPFRPMVAASCRVMATAKSVCGTRKQPKTYTATAVTKAIRFSRLAFSPDGCYGLSSADDDAVRLLGIATVGFGGWRMDAMGEAISACGRVSGTAACLVLPWHRLDQSPQDLVHGIGRSEDFGDVGVQRDGAQGQLLILDIVLRVMDVVSCRGMGQLLGHGVNSRHLTPFSSERLPCIVPRVKSCQLLERIRGRAGSKAAPGRLGRQDAVPDEPGRSSSFP